MCFKFLIYIITLAFINSDFILAQKLKTNHAFENEISSNNASGIIFSYESSQININHRESIPGSSTPYSLDKNVKLRRNGIKINVFQEFAAKSLFSTTIYVDAGTFFGSEEGSVKKGNGLTNSFKEKGHGYFIGPGLSLNQNNFAAGLKWQPYVDLQYLVETSTYDLIYNSETTNSELQLSNRYIEQFFKYSLGIRVMDEKEGMISYLSMGILNLLNPEKNINRASQNDGGTIVNTETSSKYSPYILMAGIGFLF